jgi:putative mycofactocin binding protein MftB
MMMLEETWRLSDSVSLRAEPFGAMAYDFRTRRLSFLKSRALVAVVERLGDAPTVADALASAGVGADQQPRYLRALEELAASGMLTHVDQPDVDQPVGATA